MIKKSLVKKLTNNEQVKTMAGISGIIVTFQDRCEYYCEKYCGEKKGSSGNMFAGNDAIYYPQS